MRILAHFGLCLTTFSETPHDNQELKRCVGHVSQALDASERLARHFGGSGALVPEVSEHTRALLSRLALRVPSGCAIGSTGAPGSGLDATNTRQILVGLLEYFEFIESYVKQGRSAEFSALASKIIVGMLSELGILADDLSLKEVQATTLVEQQGLIDEQLKHRMREVEGDLSAFPAFFATALRKSFEQRCGALELSERFNALYQEAAAKVDFAERRWGTPGK